jgi:hypothetical protein
LKQSLYNVRRFLLQASLGFAANTGKKGGLLKFGSFRSCSEHYIPNSRRSTVPSRTTSSTEQKEKMEQQAPIRIYRPPAGRSKKGP